MDFKDIKAIVNEAFVKKFDHALVLPDTVKPEVLSTLESEFGRVIVLPSQPTCEHLIGICVNALRHALPEGVELWRVKLSETATSYASWHLSDE